MTEAEWIKIAIELVGMACVALTAFFAVKIQVAVIAVRLEEQAKYQAEISASQARTIEKIEIEISQIANIISDQRVISERIQAIDKRVVIAEKDIWDLQHGEGMVLPLTRKGPYEKP